MDIWNMLFYSTKIDTTNKLGPEQVSATKSILSKAQRLLEYARTYPDAELVFREIILELIVQSYAMYISRNEACSTW